MYIYIYVYVFPSIAFFQRTLSHINGSPWIQYSDKDSRMKSLNIYLSSSWNRVSSSHHGWFKTKSCSNDLDDLPCPKLIEICKYTHTYITLYSIPFHSIPLHTYIHICTYICVCTYVYIYIYIHNIYIYIYIYIQAYNHIIYIYNIYIYVCSSTKIDAEQHPTTILVAHLSESFWDLPVNLHHPLKIVGGLLG